MAKVMTEQDVLDIEQLVRSLIEARITSYAISVGTASGMACASQTELQIAQVKRALRAKLQEFVEAAPTTVTPQPQVYGDPYYAG